MAFTSWRPYRDGKVAVLDLMRKRKDAPSGTMDLLVSRSLEELRGAGLEEASLANAPLANVGEPRGGLEKGVAQVTIAFAETDGVRTTHTVRLAEGERARRSR